MLDISVYKFTEKPIKSEPKTRTRKSKTDVLNNTQTIGAKKIRKNDKGETQLHLAAMDVSYS